MKSRRCSNDSTAPSRPGLPPRRLASHQSRNRAAPILIVSPSTTLCAVAGWPARAQPRSPPHSSRRYYHARTKHHVGARAGPSGRTAESASSATTVMSALSSTTRSWSWRQTPRLRARGPPTDEPRSALGRRRPFLSDGESFKLALKRLSVAPAEGLLTEAVLKYARVVPKRRP